MPWTKTKTQYKIMVKTITGPKRGCVSDPMIPAIRKKRFAAQKEAAAFAEGINLYRNNTVAKVTTEFIAEEDKDYCEEAAV